MNIRDDTYSFENTWSVLDNELFECDSTVPNIIKANESMKSFYTTAFLYTSAAAAADGGRTD